MRGERRRRQRERRKDTQALIQVRLGGPQAWSSRRVVCGPGCARGPDERWLGGK